MLVYTYCSFMCVSDCLCYSEAAVAVDGRTAGEGGEENGGPTSGRRHVAAGVRHRQVLTQGIVPPVLHTSTFVDRLHVYICIFYKVYLSISSPDHLIFHHIPDYPTFHHLPDHLIFHHLPDHLTFHPLVPDHPSYLPSSTR